MNFDEGLKAELTAIAELKDKVFPLAAASEAVAPYLVYKRGETVYNRSLSGMSKDTVSSVYSLALITKTYGTLQTISSSITDKLMSFQDKQVGESGPLILDIDPKILGDNYVPEHDEYRCDIEITVKY
jgi:hypothetical protein